MSIMYHVLIQDNTTSEHRQLDFTTDAPYDPVMARD